VAEAALQLEASELTLATAARMMREAVRDRSYVGETGLGGAVDGFLTYFRTERGKTPETVRSYEYALAGLAIHYADLSLEDFDGKRGTNLIRDFLRERYSDVAGNTWNTRVATLKAFFKWAFEEGRLDTNPAALIRYRTVPESERQAHSLSKIEFIVAAQDQRRDRIALQLLGRLALRRNELRLVQFKHVNPDTHELTVFGKGGTVRRLPLFADLYEQILRERLDRGSRPEEHLLYPVKLGRIGRHPDVTTGVIWEDRLRPLSLSGIDKWWRRCLERAGVEPFPMHELRHSAGTNFWRETRDLRLTQRLMRHKSIRTTADTYLHDDAADLAEAFDSMPSWEIED
jgi:integrase/recombinase XerD